MREGHADPHGHIKEKKVTTDTLSMTMEVIQPTMLYLIILDLPRPSCGIIQ